MDTDEATSLATALISIFAASLRDLAEGQPIPKEWHALLTRELGLAKKRGRPPEPRVQERDREIAGNMLQHYLALERGETTQRITKYAEELAEQYREKGRAFEAKDIHDIYARRQAEVIPAEIAKRLAQADEVKLQAKVDRARAIERRLATGETLDDILMDEATDIATFIAIRDHQTKGWPLDGAKPPKNARSYSERQAAIAAWIADGFQRGLYSDPLPQALMHEGGHLVRLNRAKSKSAKTVATPSARKHRKG